LRLEPVFFPGEASPKQLTAAGNPATPTQAVDRLFNVVLRTDKAIQSAFSVTFGSNSSASIKTPQFHASLIEVEELACWIQSATGSGGCNSEVVDSKVNP
jgi:hypothetical protein